MTIKFDLESFNKDIANLGASIKAIAPEALTEVSEKIIKESKEQVPVKTGRLRDSLTFSVVQEGTSTVSTLGSELPYALPVHEILEATHEVGSAKFLERPVLQNAKTLKDVITAKLKDLN